MTENKRFEVQYVNIDAFQERKIVDNKCGKKYNCTYKHQDELCGLLNALHEENEQLKEKLDYLQSSIKEINQDCKEVFKS